MRGATNICVSELTCRRRNSQARGLRSQEAIQRRKLARNQKRRESRCYFRKARHMAQCFASPIGGQDRRHSGDDSTISRARARNCKIKNLANALRDRDKLWEMSCNMMSTKVLNKGVNENKNMLCNWWTSCGKNNEHKQQTKQQHSKTRTAKQIDRVGTNCTK